MKRLFMTSAIAVVTLVTPGLGIQHDRQPQYYTTTDALMQQNVFSTFEQRPDDCPPCFNCNLGDFVCMQYANCTAGNGKCACPPGFDGDDCSQPTCGSLAAGRDRSPRQGSTCTCDDGWDGINCNVCSTDEACRPMMVDGRREDPVCYKGGMLVKENYQMCDITNRKILDLLKEQKPQATFSCNAARRDCNFQFWVDQRESFYCALDDCGWKAEVTQTRNITKYSCEKLKCQCVPGRMLCGAPDSIDLTDFLDQEIKGPASFTSSKTQGDNPSDESVFSEPAMNGLISSVFGDDSIFLRCHSGECLYKLDVPGYERPVKKINTPLIAGVIAGCALLIVALVLLVYFLGKRNQGSRHGPIHLSDDEEEENTKLLTDHKPAALYFENISYYLKGKQILSDITGSVQPGELLAIMGASGAGKTSFLDILARKKKRGTVAGDFWLNGDKIADDQFRSVIGFVDQDDTMLPTLTVHETILDSALLRLPKEMSMSAKLQKVEDVERQLGIYHIRHQMIGSEEGSGRGISGGEKRRVGIACELVTSPSVLFLDEPTSGLDAFNAFNVIECLVTLVKTYNRTVIFTIHQPRSNIVALFDQLILLAQGRIVYSGPFDRCQAYFDSIGYSCPAGFNIADYVVDLTMHVLPVDDRDFDSTDTVAEEEGRITRASSTIAVKSIPSVSNVSIGNSIGSTGDGFTRPKNKRKASLRHQQERRLFSRKNTTDTVTASPSIRSEGDSLPGEESRQNWLKLQKQQGTPPVQILDDPHDLLPASSSTTGTHLDYLTTAYVESDVAATLKATIDAAVSTQSMSNGDHAHNLAKTHLKQAQIKAYRKPNVLKQFLILARRTWRNIYRNPQLMLTHYAIAIILAVFIGFLFYGLTDNIAGFQNRLGFFFFMLALFGFSTLTSLTVFAPERLLFVRERAKGYYNPLAYYLAKVVFDIVPLRLLPPLILGCIAYPMTGLVPAWDEFLKYIMFIVLFNLAAATMCLFIGICIKNQGVANLFGILVMLFSLLFGGFLLNHNTIPKPVLWLQNLSIFHFAFEGLVVNEVRYLSLIDEQYGLAIEVPGSAILTTFGFNVRALPMDAVGLAVFCGCFLVLGYVALHFLLVEKR